MKAHAGTNKRKGNSHNVRYWMKLKKQFRTCAYDHTGAYSELRQREVSPEMKKFKRYLELTEQIMASDRYKQLRDRMAYGKNTDRLQRVLALKMPV